MSETAPIPESEIDITKIAFSREQLESRIKMIGPDNDVHAGKNYLLLLLKDGDVSDVIKFIVKTLKTLSDKGSLDLQYNFSPEERDRFKKASLNYMDRAVFLRTISWAVPGLIIMGKSILDYAVLAADGPPPEVHPHPTNLRKIQKSFTDNIMPASELMLGAALLYEGIKKAEEIKIEQISDAVNEVAEALKKLSTEEKLKHNDGPGR